jgi:hypothetical protein
MWCPGLNHICVQLGPVLPTSPFTVRSSCPHLRGNLSSLGTNVRILGRIYNYSSEHHFHYSQFNWWSSFTCQRSLMACVTGIALHWVPIPMPMPMGFGWAWVRYYCSWVGIGFLHPCIHLQIRVKLLGCREHTNQEALRVEANNSEWPFICPIQPRLGVGG